MILTCPACATRYEVDGSKFPSEGRTVRCAKCGHTWHQMPDPDPDAELFVEEPPPSEPAPESEDVSEAEAEGAVETAALAEAEPAAEPPAETFYRADDQDDGAAAATEAPSEPVLRREPESADGFSAAPPLAETEKRRVPVMAIAGVGLGWLALVGVVLAIGWAALTYREQVVAGWPQSASLYAKLGFKPVNDGLFIESLTQTEGIEDGQPMLMVTGTIVNRGREPMSLPQIRAALLTDERHELYHWTFSPSVLTLGPGQSTRFSTRVSSPPPAARHLDMRFARADE